MLGRPDTHVLHAPFHYPGSLVGRRTNPGMARPATG
jgi:hypothetical protein